MPKVYEGTLEGQGLRFGIVVSRFNSVVTDRLLEGAVNALRGHGVADDDIDDQISNWMSNNFDITDYNVDDAIDSWMENNMDDKIQDAISNLTFNVTVS